MHARSPISIRLLVRIWGLLLRTALQGFSSQQGIGPGEEQPPQELHAIVQLLLLGSLQSKCGCLLICSASACLMPQMPDASEGQCIWRTMHLEDNASEGQCIQQTMHLKDNASGGQCI